MGSSKDEEDGRRSETTDGGADSSTLRGKNSAGTFSKRASVTKLVDVVLAGNTKTTDQSHLPQDGVTVDQDSVAVDQGSVTVDQGQQAFGKALREDNSKIRNSRVRLQRRRWSAAVRRADKALDKLQRSGYDSAGFLHTVLHSIDELLSKDASAGASWSLDAYHKAIQALQMARKSRGLKHLMLTKNLEKADASCLLLRRAVLELEAVMGSLTWVDLERLENHEVIRERVTEAIVSVLSAEMHANLGKS